MQLPPRKNSSSDFLIREIHQEEKNDDDALMMTLLHASFSQQVVVVKVVYKRESNHKSLIRFFSLFFCHDAGSLVVFFCTFPFFFAFLALWPFLFVSPSLMMMTTHPLSCVMSFFG